MKQEKEKGILMDLNGKIICEKEIIQLNNKQMNLLRKVLEIKQNTCGSCNKKIDFRKRYVMFSQPFRVYCYNPFCMAGPLLGEIK